MPNQTARAPKPNLANDVIASYQRTGSCHSVAAELGIGATTAHRILRAHGLVHPRSGPQERKRKALDIAAVMRMYAAGESAGAIAERFGCSSWLVLQTIRRNDTQPKPRGKAKTQFTKEQIADIARYYAAGVSQADVGLMFGVGQATISRVLREAGVKSKQHASGPLHGSWNGGISMNGDGYILESVPAADAFASMRNNSGYVPQHRLVMARHLGRPLYRHESVHHINGDREDNRIENLQLRIGQHGSGIAMKCAHCGSASLVPVKLEEAE